MTRLGLCLAALLVILSGCSLGESPPQITRLTSPNGQTDLVLTWRGGGGAAGGSEQHIALVAHGKQAGDDDDQATLDPEYFLGGRWLSDDVAEVGLDGPIESGSLPTTVRIAGKRVTLRLRDFTRCRLEIARDLSLGGGIPIQLLAWDCGDGAGQLALSARGDGLSAQLVDTAIKWPTPVIPLIQGNRLIIPAHQLYRSDREELVGGPHGEPIRISWAG